MNTPALPPGYAISTDPGKLDLSVVHDFLSQTYWAKGIPKSVVERMIENSMCFGVYHGDAQVGFARVITDYATFAYLADVFILSKHRGKKLSKALMKTIMTHPELQDLRRWMLVTVDAQGLYGQYGFKAVTQPERHMEIRRSDLYKKVDFI